jgi:hypothetical protein
MFARGESTSGGFAAGAAGSPRFVGAYIGRAALGYGFGTAVRANHDFNDCMFAAGWISHYHRADADPALSRRLWLCGGLHDHAYPLTAGRWGTPLHHQQKNSMPGSNKKTEDRLITLIYGQHCAGMQIELTRIPALYAMVRKMLREGKLKADRRRDGAFRPAYR